jgi:hypothetical protein
MAEFGNPSTSAIDTRGPGYYPGVRTAPAGVASLKRVNGLPSKADVEGLGRYVRKAPTRVDLSPSRRGVV